MNRTLTAAVALAAGLGMAGLAQAQNSPNPADTTIPGTAHNPTMQSPNVTAPAPSMNPGTGTGSGMPPSAATTGPGSSAAEGPAANDSSSHAYTGNKQAQMSQETIQQAQQQLKAQGLYDGPIDGVVGPETAQALSQFQQKNGLPQTAALDQQTLDRLTGGSGPGSGTPGTTNSGTTMGTGSQNPAAPMGSGSALPRR